MSTSWDWPNLSTEPTCTQQQVESFVRATAGGYGKYVETAAGQVRFRQQDSAGFKSLDSVSEPNSLGYGRIEFVRNSKDSANDQPKHYIRVPAQSNASMILYFVENVWKIPRPKLLIGRTHVVMIIFFDLNHIFGLPRFDLTSL